MVLDKGVIFAGKYEILSVLSAGAQATVYTALQKPLERIVVLKILSSAVVTNQEIVSRFEREARLLSTLNDDNVTKIYDFGNYNGVYYFVSEYIEGQSIKELLERKGRLSSRAAVYIIFEVSKCLVRLHKQGIIHRDLKPGNILLSNDGKVKLTDFGLALNQALPSLTIEGSILGTPAYMSPEQILGESIDSRSDIYSLGVVFYELMTGVNPFVANSYSAIMHNVLNLKPTPLYKLDNAQEDFRDLWQVVERMMKKRTRERFEDINEVAEKLENILNKEINKSGQGEINDLSAKIQLTAPLQGLKSKPKSSFAKVYDKAQGRNKTIFIILIILFTLIIVVLIIQKRKSNLNETSVIMSSSDSIKMTSDMTILKQDSFLIKKPDTAKIKNIDAINQASVSPELIKDKISSGSVRLSVLPWAKVFIEGREAYTTPKDTVLILSAGPHFFKFDNPVFGVVESVITVRSFEDMNIVIDLTERVGYLRISVSPWADIYIDDEFMATTPIAQPIVVNSGKHRLLVKNPYYTVYQEMIDFKARETLERNIILK